MKKIKRIAVAGLLATSMAFGAMAPTLSVAAAAGDKPTSYLAIGDSMMVANSVVTDTYTKLLKTKWGLSDANCNIVSPAEGMNSISDLKALITSTDTTNEAAMKMQAMVEKADCISINLGYDDLTTGLVGGIADAVVSHTTATIPSSDSWYNKLFISIEAALMGSITMAPTEIQYLVEDIASAFTTTYSTYINDYTKCVDQILERNPKVNLILMSNVNPLKNFKITYKNYTIDVGRAADIVFENANSYIASMIISTKVRGLYENLLGQKKISFVNVNAIDYTTVPDEMDELSGSALNQFTNAANWVLERANLRTVTEGLRKAYNGYKDGTGDGVIEIGPNAGQPLDYNDFFTMICYTALEEVVLDATKDPELKLDTLANIADLTVDFQKLGDLFSNLVDAVIPGLNGILAPGTSAKDRITAIEDSEEIIKEAIEDSGVYPVLQYLGRYVWAEEVCFAPSASSHATIAAQIDEAYGLGGVMFSQYTASQYYIGKVNNVLDVMQKANYNPVMAVINGINEDIKLVNDLAKETLGNAYNTVETSIAYLADRVRAVKDAVDKAWENTSIHKINTAIINYQLTAIKNTVNAIKDQIAAVKNAIDTVVSLPGKIVKGTLDKIDAVTDGMISSISDAMNGVKDAVATVVNGINESVENAIQNTKESIKNAATAIKESVKNTASNVNNAIVSAVAGIKASINNTVANMGALLKQTIVSINDMIVKTAEGIAEFTVNAINWQIKTVSNLVNDIITNIEKGFSVVSDGVANGIEFVINGFENGAENISNLITNGATITINGVKYVINKASEGVEGMATLVIDGVKFTIKAVDTVVDTTVAGIVSGSEMVINGVKYVVSDVVTNITEGATLTAQAIKNLNAKIAETTKAVVENINDTVKTVVENVKYTISNVANNMDGIVGNIVSNVAATASKLAETVKNTIQNSAETIEAVVASSVEAIKNLADLTVSGLSNSIKVAVDTIKNLTFNTTETIKNITESITNAINASIEKIQSVLVNDIILPVLEVLDSMFDTLMYVLEETVYRVVVAIDRALGANVLSAVPSVEEILAVQEMLANEMSINNAVIEAPVFADYSVYALCAMIVALAAVTVVSFRKYSK